MGSRRSHRPLRARLTTLWVAVVVLSGLLVAPVAVATDPLPVAPGNTTAAPSTPGETQVATQSSTSFGIGDVFVAIGGGLVQWRLPDGTLNATLDTGLHGYGSDYTTGMAFDKLGNLYVTNFSAGAVTRFDKNGNRLDTFGTGYNSLPESIVFDAAGDAYVGQAGGTGDVLQFDGGGQPVATYNVPIDQRGSDWIDLAVDQCTMYYTSEGTRIKRFDVCANAVLADLTDVLTVAYALRIVPGGQGVLVADTTTIKLVDNFVGGGITRFYDAPNQDCWFALNLDPDGTSFWSADFCNSMVYKFDIASGVVLQSFSTQTPTRTVYGLVVNGEFSDARNRNCTSEDISLGQVGADTDQISIRYDPRYLVDESLANYTTQAQALMVGVRDRAVATLAEYRDQLGFTIPDWIRIEVRCKIVAFRGVPLLATEINAPGFTESDTLVQLRADELRTNLLGPTSSSPNTFWRTLVDHELYHAIWVKALAGLFPNQVDGLFRYRFLGDPSNSESSATLAQDLIAESDDAPRLPGSYLSSVFDWFSEPKTIEAGPDDPAKYQAAGFLQYLAERFGAGAALEPRAAAFLRAMVTDANGIDALAAAIGRRGQPDAVFAALRDYYIAALVHRAPNVSSTENSAYRFRDEISPHTGTSGTPPIYPVLQAPRVIESTLAAATFNQQSVGKAIGRVYVVNTLGGASTVRVTFTAPQGRFMNISRPKLAFVPIASDNAVFIDQRFMPDAPNAGAKSWVVPVAGQDRMAVIVVGGSSLARYSLKVENAGGISAIDLQKPTATNPAPAIESACPKPFITATVRPTVDGAFTDGLSRTAFTATLDGASVAVSQAYELTDTYVVVLRPTTMPAVGDHSIRVTFNGVTAPQVGQITVIQTTTCSTERDRSVRGALATLGQGQQATTTAAVAAGDVSASFSLAWTGSDFDLQLTSPSGRVITESTVAADVHVTQTSTTVQITVDAPEGGTWQLQATGASVPVPEPVTYDVVETGTAVRSELDATNAGGAGAPIVVRFSLTDDSAGLLGAAGEATVIDPAGQVRHFPLYDDGAHGDTSPNDGVYGAYVWATDLAGAYQLEVAVSGTRADGKAITRQESASLTLGPKVDTDVDGVADAAETLLGTNPTSGTDGAVDWDGDGVGLADELIAGTDYASWDTDAGGENDQSELAAGRDPRRAADDRTFPQVWLSTQAIDGSSAAISVATSDGTGQVRIYRVDDVSRTDLGLKPGTGSTFVDGPVVAGAYRYVALVVAADGSMSAPIVGPTLTLAADVTAPFVRISANDGVWAATDTNIRITFTDLSEPASHMRFAESETELQAAVWAPYRNPTTFIISSTAGRHIVYAQVRDPAGNVSNVASAIVDLALTDTTPPVSQAGSLDLVYASNTVTVPYTATDDASGVASVELWVRYRRNEAQTWAPYAMAVTGTSSPFTYTFANGDGNYEFYTIAVDNAGNREVAPTVADAATRRDAVDDPPDLTFGANAQKYSSSAPITLVGAGTAADDRSPVTVTWQLYGVKSNGQRQKLFNFKPATATDGAFDSRIEMFRLDDQRDGNWVSYDIDVKVTAGGQSVTRTTRIGIFVCDHGGSCTGQPLP